MHTDTLTLPTWSSPAPMPRRFNAHLLNVTFESPDRMLRTTVGGGESVAEAIAAARDELPLGVSWTVARWSPVYGE
jgi:hypothetical protein